MNRSSDWQNFASGSIVPFPPEEYLRSSGLPVPRRRILGITPANLKRRFDEYKGGSHKLPRPGTRVRPEIEVAPTVEIEPYELLASEFFEMILAMNYDECLVTDESSL